jgi:hypothetical protein
VQRARAVQRGAAEFECSRFQRLAKARSNGHRRRSGRAHGRLGSGLAGPGLANRAARRHSDLSSIPQSPWHCFSAKSFALRIRFISPTDSGYRDAASTHCRGPAGPRAYRDHRDCMSSRGRGPAALACQCTGSPALSEPVSVDLTVRVGPQRPGRASRPAGRAHWHSLADCRV